MFLSYQPMVRYNNWAYTKNQSAEFAFSISSKGAHTGGIGRVELLGTGQGQRLGRIKIHSTSSQTKAIRGIKNEGFGVLRSSFFSLFLLQRQTRSRKVKFNRGVA